MAYTPEYQDPSVEPGSEYEFAILPAGDHYCRLHLFDVTPAEQSQYKKPQLKWTFIGTDYQDQHGRQGIISKWTGTKYGIPDAALTVLIDSMFGRQLTEQEAKSIDFEKLPNQIEGWVRVVEENRRNIFSDFVLAEGEPLPEPSAFFADRRPAPPQRPGPAQGRPAPMSERPIPPTPQPQRQPAQPQQMQQRPAAPTNHGNNQGNNHYQTPPQMRGQQQPPTQQRPVYNQQNAVRSAPQGQQQRQYANAGAQDMQYGHAYDPNDIGDFEDPFAE